MLKEWLRNVTLTPLWSPSRCLAVFPASGEHADSVALQQMLGHIWQQNSNNNFHKEVLDVPLPVDATTMERMQESLVGRRELCLYDEEMQAAPVIHFMCNHKMNVRMLVHFYAFLFFEDWREDLWMKRYVSCHCFSAHSGIYIFFRRRVMLLTCHASRPVMLAHSHTLCVLLLVAFLCTFVHLFIHRHLCRRTTHYSFMRDHMRYVDELQCAAARIVSAIREHARSKNPSGNPSGNFDTFHIRRGDFQYKNTRISADKIYENVKDILVEGATVYIATDEKSKSFFEPLKQHYDVLFMDDFMPQLKGVNKNQFGMIDQLVASRGRLFFGCWHSTYV